MNILKAEEEGGGVATGEERERGRKVQVEKKRRVREKGEEK